LPGLAALRRWDGIQKLGFEAHDGVEHALRGLRDVGDVLPPGILDVASLVLKGLAVPHTGEHHPARINLQRVGGDVIQGLEQRGLPAAGFPGDAEDLVFMDVKMDIIHHVHIAVDGVVGRGEMVKS
jgi:hypothetical protein